MLKTATYTRRLALSSSQRIEYELLLNVCRLRRSCSSTELTRSSTGCGEPFSAPVHDLEYSTTPPRVRTQK